MMKIDLETFADWDVLVAIIACGLAFAIVIAVAGPDLIRRRSSGSRLVRQRWFGV